MLAASMIANKDGQSTVRKSLRSEFRRPHPSGYARFPETRQLIFGAASRLISEDRSYV